MKLGAAAIGNEALVQTEGLFVKASNKLKSATQEARDGINQSFLLNFVTLASLKLYASS